MAVDNGRGDVDQLPSGVLGVVSEQLERSRVVDGVALHQDALGPLGHGATPERALEVVVLGEAAQDDVDRALPVCDPSPSVM